MKSNKSVHGSFTFKLKARTVQVIRLKSVQFSVSVSIKGSY